MNIDVVVIGAGPIGITTASSLKALNPQLNICVLDKRAVATRNHGLKINADSVDKIQQTLLKVHGGANVLRLNAIFQGWSGQFIRTVKIEEDLAIEAKAMGVTLLRGPEYEVKESEFNALCDGTSDNETLQRIFRSAQVIIGADSAHSVVRKVAMNDELVDEEVLRYLAELKYQTDSATKPRSYLAASSASVKHGNLSFESMNKTSNTQTKPVTLHIFIDKPVFDSLRPADSDGNLKGVYGNSWTLAELEVAAKTDRNIRKIFNQFTSYLESVDDFADEKISTLEMRIFRSSHSALHYRNKQVLLVGDAESGIVLEGGFNKGLKGAAECAFTVNEYFLHQDQAIFHTYEKNMVDIFENERAWTRLKDNALSVLATSAASSHETSSTSSSCISQ